MSGKLEPNKNELVLFKNRSLAITKSNLVKHGLELIDEGQKRKGTPPTDRKKKEDTSSSRLVSALEVEEGIFVSIDEIQRTGGGLLSDHKRKEMEEIIFEVIKEVQKTRGGILTDHEKKAIGFIIYDSEVHVLCGLNIFSSRAAFDSFINTDVKYHAEKEKKVDFGKAKEAFILWAKKYHSSEYNQLVWEET